MILKPETYSSRLLASSKVIVCCIASAVKVGQLQPLLPFERPFLNPLLDEQLLKNTVKDTINERTNSLLIFFI